MFGSSPRTWGTQDDVAGFLLGFRFIPTHLGNACRLRNGSGMKTVHPHARGERGRRDERQVIHLGSSPRTWGTLVPPTSASWLRRFIPKHVGNARRTRHRQTPGPVHPHARGERLCGRAQRDPLTSNLQSFLRRLKLINANLIFYETEPCVGFSSRRVPPPRKLWRCCRADQSVPGRKSSQRTPVIFSITGQ